LEKKENQTQNTPAKETEGQKKKKEGKLQENSSSCAPRNIRGERRGGGERTIPPFQRGRGRKKTVYIIFPPRKVTKEEVKRGGGNLFSSPGKGRERRQRKRLFSTIGKGGGGNCFFLTGRKEQARRQRGERGGGRNVLFAFYFGRGGGEKGKIEIVPFLGVYVRGD